MLVSRVRTCHLRPSHCSVSHSIAFTRLLCCSGRRSTHHYTSKTVSSFVNPDHFQQAFHTAFLLSSSLHITSSSFGRNPMKYPLVPLYLSSTASSASSRPDSAADRTKSVKYFRTGSMKAIIPKTIRIKGFWILCARESTMPPGSIAKAVIPDNFGS